VIESIPTSQSLAIFFVLRQLHWLPVRRHVELFKIASLVYTKCCQAKFLAIWLTIFIRSSLRKFCSLPHVFFGEKVISHSCSQSFWRQMFCCSWTTCLEQLTCHQSARQGSQLHRIQKTTENIHVSDGLRRIVTFLIFAPYKYSYLLTYNVTSETNKKLSYR